MPVDLASFNTLIALVVVIVFGLTCYLSMPRAILIYTIAGAFPLGIFLRFSGREQEDGLRLGALLATTLIAVWCLKRLAGRGRPIIRTPFNVPLLLLIPVSFVSMAAGFTWYDRAVPEENMNAWVSLGQIALLIWPSGTYLVVASSITDVKWIRRIETAIYLLALPAYLFPFVPDAAFIMLWSVSFSLAAAPLAFARLLEPAPLGRRVMLALLAIGPLVVGISYAKAAWYIAAAASLATVAILKGRFAAMVVGPLLVVLAALVTATISDRVVPPPLSWLVDAEVRQKSLGGRGGRLQLAIDAANIWSGHPILGVGPGNMWPYMHVYSGLDTPHNQYSNILLELGIAGFACLAGFVVGAFRTGLRLLRLSQVAYHRHFIIGWLGLFAGLVASAFTGDVMLPSIRNAGLWTFTAAYLQWILLGLMVSLARIEYRERVGPAISGPATA
jgi:O-antigen ligase